MMYEKCPGDFRPKFEAAGCFLQHGEKILLLLRKSGSYTGSWGLPNGKLEEGETSYQGMAREINEETGLTVTTKRLHLIGRYFVRFPEYDFVYYLFSAVLEDPEEITLDSKEHSDYRWVTVDEALSMRLVRDLDRCIELFGYPKQK